jgi:lysophospholipase L1-like esterase
MLRTITAKLRSTFVIFFALTCGVTLAQNKAQVSPVSPNSPFELKNGERVVFLGNSVFENDFQYGYLELALSTRWPNRDITFRNLGWTGDNVYGVARSTITNPPTGYELLMEHLTKAQPTLVFIAYGGIEAQDDEAGLPNFKTGLTKLLDKVDQLGASAILLSPIPVMMTDSGQSVSARNAILETYAAAIAKTAAERGKRYIDIFKPLQELSKKAVITDNGIHLNETGYYYLATILEQKLGLPQRFSPVMITVDKKATVASGPAKMLNDSDNSANLTFTLADSLLPLPLPTDDRGITSSGQVVKISGLKKGFYTLIADKEQLVTASAKEWEAGVEIRQGGLFEQVRALRQMILKKNDLFYFQYRPLNTTYILGFRSYEQGRHVKGLEEQSILIKWLEGQINLSRKPLSRIYQLTQLK